MSKSGKWPVVRRWLKRIAWGLLTLILLLLLVGVIYEFVSRHNAAKNYPPRGQMVDIGGRKMHIDCRGTGSPTVVFEAGLGSGGSLDWALVHDQIATVTRACAYDRAGIMWSDAKSTPQDAVAVADDLHATLKGAGITDPIVLVGHSIGGPYITTYTGKYGDQVAGLVMVDPSRPGQIERLGKITGGDLDPRQYLRMVNIVSALTWTGGPRLALSGEKPGKLSAEVVAQKSAYSSLSVKGSQSELEGFGRTLEQALQVKSFGNRPLIVLTAMAPFTPDQMKAMKITADQANAFKQGWKGLHTEYVAMTPRGRQIEVPDATHYIQVDRPDVVIAAVKDVVGIVRADEKTAASGQR